MYVKCSKDSDANKIIILDNSNNNYTRFNQMVTTSSSILRHPMINGGKMIREKNVQIILQIRILESGTKS